MAPLKRKGAGWGASSFLDGLRKGISPRDLTRAITICGLLTIALLMFMQKPMLGDVVEVGSKKRAGGRQDRAPPRAPGKKGGRGGKGKDAPRQRFVGKEAIGEEDEFAVGEMVGAAEAEGEVAKLMYTAEKLALQIKRAKEKKLAAKNKKKASEAEEGGAEEGEEAAAEEEEGGGEEDENSGDDKELDPAVVKLLKGALSSGGSAAWRDCSKDKTFMPDLSNLPTRLPRKMNQTDMFVHQGNHVKQLRGDFAIHRKSVQFLPRDGDAIMNSYRFRSCAVVGNGGGMRLSNFGKAIDSHDVVLRLNQAPTQMYRRFVGSKTTFRLMNRLWTAHYGSGRFVEMKLPMERGLTIVISRSTGHLYDKMLHTLYKMRPDVAVMYLSSRLVSAVRRLLITYRVKLCAAGYGPFGGGNTPSSGLVAIYTFMQICKRTSVYGFGQSAVTGVGRVPYHYYTGTGSRVFGDPVHSFQAEEALIKRLGREDLINLCQYDHKNSSAAQVNNRRCGMNEFITKGRDGSLDAEQVAREDEEERMTRRNKRFMSIGGSGAGKEVFMTRAEKEAFRAKQAAKDAPRVAPARQGALDEADAFTVPAGGAAVKKAGAVRYFGMDEDRH